MAHLLEGLIGAWDDRRGLVGGEQYAAAKVLVDGEVLVRDWRRKEAGELHRLKAELASGSGWLEEVWSGGSTTN